jgi:hypothetical protein
MSAEDLINRVKQRRLNKPTSDLPPTYPPYPTYPANPNAPTTTTPPDRPSLILPYQPTGQIAAEAAKGGNDKGFLGNLLSIPGSAVKGVFSGISQLPQLGKDIVMTGVGTAEEALNAVDDTLIPFYDYTTRADKRRKQAEEMGLKGYEALNYELAHTYPFVTKFADSVQTLGGNVAELVPLAKIDVGEPGVNYKNAYNRGDLGEVLVGDIGTVLTAGRFSGLGNLGVRAGAKVTSAGAPRLGSTISSASRFVEEPIGTTVRGTARVGNLAADRLSRLSTLGNTATSRLSGFADRAGRVAEAPRPLRQTLDETVGARRLKFEGRLTDLINEETRLTDAIERLPQGDQARIKLDEELTKVIKDKEKALTGTGRPKLLRQELRAQQRAAEATRTFWVTTINRWGNEGSVPASVRILNGNAKAARVRQQEATTAGNTQDAQFFDDQATYFEEAATLKQSDVNGRLNPKNWDDVEKQTIWSSAVLIMTKVKEEIVRAYDSKIREGMTHEQAIDYITRNITPPELLEDVARQGYAWTPQAIDRVVRFAKGQLDEFDSMNIEGAARLIDSFSKWFSSQAEQGIGRVTGAIPFTYRYNLPDPMNMLRQLKDRLKLKTAVYEILDEAMADVLRRDHMDIVTEQKIDLDDPTGLFEKYAEQRPDSEQYAIAYKALTEAFDELVADPQTSTFMQNRMIYPAAMRPVMSARERLTQAARAEDVTFMADEMAQLAVQNQDLIPGRTLKSIATAIKLALGEQTKYDVRTWVRVQATLNRLVADAQKAQAEYQGAGAKLSGGIDSTMARLQQIEQFAVAANAMIDQVIANPDIVFPDLANGSPRLVAARQAEQANLSRIDAIPDEMAQVDAEIKAEIDRQRTANAYLQQELDNTQVSLDEARTRATETADAEATVRQQLDQEQAYIDAYNKLTEEELAALRSPDGEEPPFDLKKAMEIHDTYASGDKFVSKGTAQSVKNRLVREATERLTIAQGLVDSLMPSRLRRSRTMTIGLATDPNAMSFMQEDFRAPFESAVYQAIGDPKLAKKAYNDFVNSRTVMDEGVAVDQLSMETGRDFASDSDFMAELGRAWAEQWQAEKDLGRAKQKGVEAIRKELAADNQAMIDQAMEASTVTGQTLPWIERMIELDDRATLAEATRTVEGLRRDLAKAEQVAQKAQADLNKLAAKVAKLTDQARPKVPNELLSRRIKLEKEIATTKKATGRLARVVESAQKAEPKTIAKLVREARAARLEGVGKIEAATARIDTLDNEGNPVRLVGVNPRAGQARMLPGLAGKLEAEQQTLLVKQAELDAKLADVRRRAAEQDALEQQTQTIQGEAQALSDLQGQPMGPQLLAQSRAARLNVEGASPIYYPAGETSSVTPQARIETRLRSEAAGAERQTATEGVKTTNVMAMTFDKFSERVNEILGQAARNVVIQNLIKNRDFVTDVSFHFTDEQLVQFDIDARNRLRSQRTNLNSREFEQLVKKEVGNTILQKLKEQGLEPISKVQMPDPEDIYTGRSALDTFKDIVEGQDIDATTLVMPIGMRGRVASSFVAKADGAVPDSVKRIADFIGDKTSRWKSWILPISVRWQVGDYMGNIINAWVRGDIDPKTMMEMMKLVDELIREDTTTGKLKSRTGGVTNRTFNNPVLQALIGEGIQGRSLRLEDIRDILSSNKGALPVGDVNARFGRDFRKKAFNFNEYMNTQQKLAVAMVKLQEALDKQGRTMADIDPVTLYNDPQLRAAVTEAVQFANETLGSFSDMSPWERNVIRQVFPFWSWIKFINTAAGKLLLDSPDRVLFYSHLGSMTMDPDSEGLYSWLQGKTPIGGLLFDLSFTNPYTDAIFLQKNPFEAGLEQATSISPVLSLGLSTLGEAAYFATGRKYPLLMTPSRPSYLEGGPEASARTIQDSLGAVAYLGLKSFGGPARNLLEVGPADTRIPLTDIAVGPGKRFGQGSLRTEGRYSELGLTNNTARLSSILRTFGLPGPIISMEEAKRQAEEQRIANEKARLQRIQDRINAG